jgi:hypothetical protein
MRSPFRVRAGLVQQIVGPDPYRANAFAAAKDALDHVTAPFELFVGWWDDRWYVSAKQNHGFSLLVDCFVHRIAPSCLVCHGYGV